ncbi:hypothetical protein OH76DRAFT_178826 [Lentinus brumalis]|uniref:Uncharacterized protein n=1 Tax=Lentinus brumalis TaxID=2498619 RepID=A0A371CNI2_9APHY|nr:hypothetical protein OH76DRAFT_178826 [Polyporus brumalis]
MAQTLLILPSAPLALSQYSLLRTSRSTHMGEQALLQTMRLRTLQHIGGSVASPCAGNVYDTDLLVLFHQNFTLSQSAHLEARDRVCLIAQPEKFSNPSSGACDCVLRAVNTHPWCG